MIASKLYVLDTGDKTEAFPVHDGQGVGLKFTDADGTAVQINIPNALVIQLCGGAVKMAQRQSTGIVPATLAPPVPRPS